MSDHDIDPQWVDIDFREESGDFGRGWAGLGEPDCANFEYAESVIARSEWRETPIPRRESMLSHYHLNQGPEPTCTANGLANCIMAEFRESLGVNISVSPISLYNHCGNPRSGSTTSCITRQARDTGCLLIDNDENKEVLERMGLDPRHVLPQRGTRLSPSKWPRGWQETAQHFRLAEVYQVRTVEAFFSALFRGYALLYGRQGHAICAVTVVYKNGRWLVKYKNSWNEDWGDGGYGYDSERLIRQAVPWVYAVRSLVATEAHRKLIQPPQVAI